MTQEHKNEIPDWALRERERDLEWVGEILHIFWLAATDAFVNQGRGAIIADTTSRPTGEGHPFGYFPQAFVAARDDEGIKCMVREYDPDNEFVVVMIKPDDRMSTYRVQTRQHNG